MYLYWTVVSADFIAVVYSGVALPMAMDIVSDLCNIEIGTNILFTLIALVLVYGGYYLATSLSCEKMICKNER